MKYIFITILSLALLYGNAQAAVTKQVEPLTVQEVDFLRQGYTQMIQSEVYKDAQKLGFEVGLKLNNLKYPKDIELLDKEEVKQWLAVNLDKTRFSSIEEGMEMITEYAEKTKELFIKYAEVQRLLKKAAMAGQAREVFEPMDKEGRQAIHNQQ